MLIMMSTEVQCLKRQPSPLGMVNALESVERCDLCEAFGCKSSSISRRDDPGQAGTRIRYKEDCWIVNRTRRPNGQQSASEVMPDLGAGKWFSLAQPGGRYPVS